MYLCITWITSYGTCIVELWLSSRILQLPLPFMLCWLQIAMLSRVLYDFHSLNEHRRQASVAYTRPCSNISDKYTRCNGIMKQLISTYQRVAFERTCKSLTLQNRGKVLRSRQDTVIPSFKDTCSGQQRRPGQEGSCASLGRDAHDTRDRESDTNYHVNTPTLRSSTSASLAPRMSR